MSIKVFADGADIRTMLEAHRAGTVQGFTTNPSLMKAGGVTDYRSFARRVLDEIRDMPVSFEVFAADERGMAQEAQEIARWGENVYVKIPAFTVAGESTAELVRSLSSKGIKINVTALFTTGQAIEFIAALDEAIPSIISIFAGRIADTGVDPIPLVTEVVDAARRKPRCEVLWASTRELLNIHQAEGCGCQIITVSQPILAKRDQIGRDLIEYSLETVRDFARDGAELGFRILP